MGTFFNATVASYHIFNTTTFRDCVGGKRIAFHLGPSYMRDLHRTAVDLLHGVNTEDVITYPNSTTRNPVPDLNSSITGPGFDNIRYFGLFGFTQSWERMLSRR